MTPDEQIRVLEETKNEIIRFTNELDDKLARKELDQVEYHVQLHEKLGGKTEEEVISYIDKKILAEKNRIKEEIHGPKNKKIIAFGAAAIVLILMAVIGIIYTNPGMLTGQVTATRQTQEIINYSRTFDQYTETQLELNNLVGLKISGVLEGASAKVKLRINGTDYLIADIKSQQEQNQATGLITEEIPPDYTISTDKTTYALGETATITITPGVENRSLYVSYGEETHKLEGNTYAPLTVGEYTAVALIVLPNDILRIETNFTVTEQAAETPIEITPEPTLPTGYEFTSLCTETCTMPETSQPILIIEPAENSTLTITTITITQSKENSAPEQTHNIQDINLATGQTTTINLNQYFTDTDGDTIQYDINQIPEISAQITQNTLTISSDNTGTYTAFIYATDGDKLTTSNTFQITITQEAGITPSTNDTAPITNETIVPTTTIPSETIDPCTSPDPNLRPPECMEGKEEEYFVLESVFLKDSSRANAARVTPLGNLMIKGQLFENASMNPTPEDFKVSYLNENYENVPVAWIDSATGDLYLMGMLHEEDFFLSPTRNAFVIQNKRNINLAYIDRGTGDLHIKGNLIQLRENIE